MAMVTHGLERLSHASTRRGTVRAQAPRAYGAIFKTFCLCTLAALTAGVLLAAIIAVETAFYMRSLINRGDWNVKQSFKLRPSRPI
jgi:hypothetical protein